MSQRNQSLPIEAVCEATSGSGRAQMTAVLLQLGHLRLEVLSTDVQEVLPKEITSFPTHEKTTVTTCMILSYQHLLAFSSDADMILHRALEMRLIYWECQKEGKSWGRAATGFSHLLQHQKCEFPYMPPLGHGGATVLETSPRTKAASLALRGGETAWHPCRPSHRRLAGTVSAIFITFLVSEVYHQKASSRGSPVLAERS